MKVSVIVSAYNIEEYIEKCLLSIMNQTLYDIEIIIVNDGSRDNTLKKIKDIAKNDKRINIINQENKGSIEARKAGLNIANGEYILFVDGDDWLEINALELLYENAINNNSDIVIYDAYLSYDDRKENLNIISDNNIDENDYIKNLFLSKLEPSIWSKFVKTDFIRTNNIRFPSDISYAEDLAAVSCWFMHNPKVTILNENLYNYYQRETSITKTKNTKALEVDKAISFIKEILIEKNLYNKYIAEFECLVYMHQFHYCFLDYANEEGLNIKLYEQYKRRNINIKRNKYISDKIKKYPLSLRIRTNSYDKGYKCGKLYDSLRDLVRSS